MRDNVKIIPLGGLDENGKNCTVVSINDDLFVIECGIRYPERTMPGIDYVIPDFTYLKENKDRVKAYVLLHGHDDEIGGLAYLYKDVKAPVYGTKVTLAMLERFCKHNHISEIPNDLHVVSGSDDVKIAGRTFSFFRTSHNIAQSCGVAIETSLGNIVFTSDYVIENNSDENYLCDLRRIAQIGEKPTLILLAESTFAGKKGYTAPNYKLTPLVERSIRDSKGRVFVSSFSTNFYNIEEIIRLAVASKKKIIPYDEDTSEILLAMQEAGQLLIPKENFAPKEDILRVRSADSLILILGVGSTLFAKIGLLASKKVGSGLVYIGEDDTFIMASPSNDNTDVEATDAIDALYRTGCEVKNITRKVFLRMHASEEDLKMMIALLRPKFYCPVSGYYKDMLSNAQVALSMGINLSHRNVFLLENGLSLIIDEAGARLFDEKIPHDDVYIDGIGVGDVEAKVIEDRGKLAQGLLIIAATVSKKKRRVVSGPDIQVRGLVQFRDSDALLKETSRIFTSAVNEFLVDEWDLDEFKETLYDRLRYSLRRQIGSEPMVLPLIVEID